jgi:preprotein translocase subunit SecF
MDFRGKNIDLVGRIRLWFGISLAIILVGIVSWIAFGLNLGIDFSGGGQVQYRIDPKAQSTSAVTLVSQMEEAIKKNGLEKVKVQVAGGDTFIIQTQARTDAELRNHENVVKKSITEVTKTEDERYLTPLSRELVGPVIGDELRRNAINGVVLGVLLIAAWIYLRYNFAGGGLRYAVGGIVALVHDVFVLIGLFALIGRFWPSVEIDGTFIAALLTVVGYSINDSVVIFDRIRENLRLRRREEFNTIVNDSLLETMSRSINTGFTVLIMLLVLLFFGGHSIYNFVLAMLIGIASGLYSSIFNASMVLVAWNNWDNARKGVAPSTTTRLAREATPKLAGTSAINAANAASSVAPKAETSSSSVSPGTASRPASSGKARRRF